jgi:hypothetical protein
MAAKSYYFLSRCYIFYIQIRARDEEPDYQRSIYSNRSCTNGIIVITSFHNIISHIKGKGDNLLRLDWITMLIYLECNLFPFDVCIYV